MSEATSTRKRKHHGKKKESLEVLCRLAPCCDEDPAVCIYNETTVRTCPPANIVQRSGSPYPETLYKFGYVFDDCESQHDVFERSTMDLIEQLVRGKSGLLFTYGVTGSGKTYTMTGHENGKNCGILPRTMNVLFKSLPCQMDRCVFKPDGKNGFEVCSEQAAAKAREESQDVPARRESLIPGTKKVKGFNEQMVSAVFVSYVEIYNNLCYDLFDESLTDERRNMSRDLRVNGTSVYVDQVSEIEVQTAEQVMELYERAQERRMVADTLLNKTSSRSHSIFNIRVVMAPCREDAYYPVDDVSQIVVGQLSLVDLAGSERAKRTANIGDRMVEANKINQSLMVLRQCFEKIRERDRSNLKSLPIPYRDSKVTLLFKNFFEGSGKIRMIICVNPRASDFEENLNVLNFGELSQDIRTTDGPDPVMPKLLDSTNQQFSRRDILAWRKRFNDHIQKFCPPADFTLLKNLPRVNLTDAETMGLQIETRRKVLMTNSALQREYGDQSVKSENGFRDKLVNVLCKMDLTNSRLKAVVSENDELRADNDRLQKLLNQMQRENSALKLRIARNEVEEDYKLRREERDRQKAADMEEEYRAKNRKIKQMRELFESKTKPSHVNTPYRPYH